ncbi:hypothetical protein WMY93_010162 [Mugilogobius chulae]|uniref:Ion transport domain-containing protein n=1 Tax=Mugilogobius chulae TaxID=88201 RepID=A0AAW0P6T0_9GOBI
MQFLLKQILTSKYPAILSSYLTFVAAARPTPFLLSPNPSPFPPMLLPLFTEAQSKPYYSDYSPTRLLIHKLCTSHYLDLFITIVIGLNVITMSMEHYQQPEELDEALKICNYIFTLIFVLESVFKLVAFGFRRFFKDKWNQLDLAIVLLSIMGITLEEIEVNASLPINPTIIRIMRVLRIARVLKLLKMAVGMRALLDTVMQALPQVGNLGLLFMLLFFIFAALGVELFGDLICDELHPCEGLGRYATFKNFGMAFLLLFRVSTGDNWNGIMKDTLRDCAHDTSTCYNTVVSPILLRLLRVDRPVRPGQRGHRRAHETPGGKQQRSQGRSGDGGRAGHGDPQRGTWRRGGGGGGSGGDAGCRSPQITPQGLGLERSGSGGSSWRSAGGGGGEGGGEGQKERTEEESPEITRENCEKAEEPCADLEPQYERRAPLDSVSLVMRGSMEFGELGLMDNLSGSVCRFYALPPRPGKRGADEKIPLAEMEALSLASERSWSLADDSTADDFNPLFLTSLERNPESLNGDGPQEKNLLSVRKPAVGRTHSLPNDSYMFPPLDQSDASTSAQLLPQTQRPHHVLGSHKGQSGSSSSVRSQPEDCSQKLTVPADLFRPISPQSLSDSESIVPRLPPPRRTHTLSRPLRRQVAVSADSQEALCSDTGQSGEGLVNVASWCWLRPPPVRWCSRPCAQSSRVSPHTQSSTVAPRGLRKRVWTRRCLSSAAQRTESVPRAAA